MQLRDYQYELSTIASQKLDELGMVYLSMEVRTGKTLTSIAAASNIIKLLGTTGRVLFVTKKKAIKDIVGQFEAYVVNNPTIGEFMCINYESVHNIYEHLENLDVIILDEAHSLGAFPKSTGRFKKIQHILNIKSNRQTKVILLSGTPSPESYSQLYHQFSVSKYYSPFKSYTNFYKWAVTFVNKTQKYLGHGMVNDYSDAKKILIDQVLEPYFISYTQGQAGFTINVEEVVLEVEMKEVTGRIIKALLRDLVFEGNTQTIVADTGVKLQSKIHQLCSGTIKFDDGTHAIIDTSKADFIKYKFEGHKIAIFYKFKAEFELLKSIFTNFTTEPTEFNESEDLVFLGQIQSVREGINLSTADCLVMYNIDFSAVSYWQGRDRMSTKDRIKDNKVYWIFAEGGIEQKVYKKVMDKRDYTNSYFLNEYNIDKQKFKQDEKEKNT